MKYFTDDFFHPKSFRLFSGYPYSVNPVISQILNVLVISIATAIAIYSYCALLLLGVKMTPYIFDAQCYYYSFIFILIFVFFFFWGGGGVEGGGGGYQFSHNNI